MRGLLVGRTVESVWMTTDRAMVLFAMADGDTVMLGATGTLTRAWTAAYPHIGVVATVTLDAGRLTVGMKNGGHVSVSTRPSSGYWYQVFADPSDGFVELTPETSPDSLDDSAERRMFWMRVAGLSVREIVGVEGSTLDKVGRRIHRAKRALGRSINSTLNDGSPSTRRLLAAGAIRRDDDGLLRYAVAQALLGGHDGDAMRSRSHEQMVTGEDGYRYNCVCTRCVEWDEHPKRDEVIIGVPHGTPGSYR
jgi:hypothetical protein